MNQIRSMCIKEPNWFTEKSEIKFTLFFVKNYFIFHKKLLDLQHPQKGDNDHV